MAYNNFSYFFFHVVKTQILNEQTKNNNELLNVCKLIPDRVNNPLVDLIGNAICEINIP
jgi:hypothetical protein